MKHYRELPKPTRHDQLLVSELPKNIEFKLKRWFLSSSAECGKPREGHFHRAGQQIIQCISGSIKFTFWDGCSTKLVIMDDRSAPILLSSPLWRTYELLQTESIFLVICDLNYEDSKTSYSEQEFLKALK